VRSQKPADFLFSQARITDDFLEERALEVGTAVTILLVTGLE
jgi:hypothetical protein